MRVLIIGAGVSGCGAADLAIAKGFSVVLIDQFSSDTLVERAENYRKNGVKVVLECSAEKAMELVELADEVILSPGIDPSGFFKAALETAKVVSSELEFGARFCECPIWGITGTNGKTTTVEMTVHVMKSCGLNVIAAGNIGFPMSLAALLSHELDGVVVEISSFQLERIKCFKPNAAAVLNITSDHIDRYDGFADYAQTKLKILQTVSQKMNRLVGESVTKLGFDFVESEVIGEGDCELSHVGTVCFYNNEPIFSKCDLSVTGEHNFYNAMTASWFALKAGLKPEQIAESLKSFHTGAHRLEMIYDSEELMVYNDSKSTNPDSLICAIEAVAENDRKNIILIAGGRDKEMDFSQTVKLLQNNVKTAILIGETKTKLKQVWTNSTKCLISTNLKDAVDTAFEELSGDEIILLSPGCASQDMFRDYKERGEVFRDEILRRINDGNL